MAELKVGDIVEYIYPKFPEGHGAIAVVESITPAEHYPIHVRWIYRNIDHWESDTTASYSSCWRKLGELGPEVEGG